MESTLMDQLATALRKFLPDEYENTSLTPLLGGRSGTQIFLVNVNKKTYVLRITEPGICLSRVEQIYRLMEYAAKLGIAPQIYAADVSNRSVIMEYIRGRNLDQDWDQNGNQNAPSMNLTQIQKIARILKKLHGGPRMDRAPTTFDNIRERVAQIEACGAVTPAGFVDWLAQLARIEAVIKKHVGIWVPCHGDLNPANLIRRGDDIYLLDWDRSGLGDPFRDLATVAVFLNFSTEQSKAFLGEYFDGQFDARNFAHFYLLRHCHLLLGAFWALQYPKSNRSDKSGGLAKGPAGRSLGGTTGRSEGFEANEEKLWSADEMNQRLNDPSFPIFDQRDPRQLVVSATDYQRLALSCIKQFLAYTSSFDFKLHLDVLETTPMRSIFSEKN